MITLRAANYAKVLFSMGLKEESIHESADIFRENKELMEVLENPSIKESQKDAVIHSIFPKEIQGFIKVLCANRYINIVDMIFDEYQTLFLESRNMIKGKLSYVTRPDETELGQIEDMICSKYNKAGVSLELVEDTSLIGGFTLTIGDTVYDKSIKGTLEELGKTLARR